ncbi:MAG: hypothetical protein KGL02_03235 [Acidobacteriota bacterium]|nr:hypothetical protein [Acidobacteriota bacterium]MDE3169239.1 hypothetical protein [Acidobacteriota bacterium]
MLALLGVSPALAAVSPSFARTSPAASKRVPEAANCGSDNSMVSVLNPAIATRFADRVPLAPRLSTLEGKTIYLVDTDWGGMQQNDGILEEIQKWFAQNIPSAKIIIKIKAGNFVTDDPGLWKEIAGNHGDGVVIGVAG